jgi:hypothetical protein
MKSFLVLVGLVSVLAPLAPALAGPGDPRLVNGVLEWPRAVTNEPFVVVRGDDGVLYYVGIAAARRDAALTAGARIAVLGLEGRTPHEISALGVGAGESVEAALANLQGARPAPAAAAAGVVTPPTAAATTPAGATPPSIITAPPASNVRSAAVPPPARRSIVETAPAPAALPASASDDRRWTEISGVVESLVGRTLVLRSEEGRIAVDVSSLSQNLERMVTPGSMVRVYGVPVEIRFKAMGFFDPGTRP